MMLALLLACAPKPPPPLFSAPIRRIDIAPVDVREPAEGECIQTHTIGPGDDVPCVGVLLPVAGPESLTEAMEHRRRDEGLTRALGACYIDYEQDRAWAEDRSGACHVALQASEREARLHRPLGPIAFVGGVVVGLGTALGVYWAADSL